MAHHSRLDKIVIDLAPAHHDREVAFWSGVIGRPLAQSGAFPSTTGARFPGRMWASLIQRLDEGASRVHLDVHTTDLDAEVARLEQLGATQIRQVHGWSIMQDQADLQFCVIPDGAERLTDEDAMRWE